MRDRIAFLVVALSLLVAACGVPRDDPVTTSTPGAGAESPAASSVAPAADEAPAPEPVSLGRLPPQGVVVARSGGLDFVDLSGRIVLHLDGFRLYLEWTVPGPVMLRGPGGYYLLDIDRHELDPLPSRDAAFEQAPQFQDDVDPAAGRFLDLDVPARAAPDAGFWAYALRSPDGSALLAQWSGECEVPVAYFLRADGRDPRAVFRGPGSPTPMSRGLGWTTDGRALVQLLSGACGTGGTPGVYLVSPREGAPLLVARTPRSEAARMWGPA